jgi:hypothetical protein
VSPAWGTGRYEQAVGAALTASRLLLVVLLKHAELRAETAIQVKLDALSTGFSYRRQPSIHPWTVTD